MRKVKGKRSRPFKVRRRNGKVVISPARQIARERHIPIAKAERIAMRGSKVKVKSPTQAEIVAANLAGPRCPIERIRVGKRHRSDYGDIAGLARSIDERGGLLQQIAVKPLKGYARYDFDLIAGERRMLAWPMTKFKGQPIPINVIDVDKIVLGERDENLQRKAFTRSEQVAIALECEPIEKAMAIVRQRQHGGTAPGRAAAAPPKAAAEEKGAARDRVAALVGMDRKTLDKAQAVVEAARQHPKKFGALLEQMDRTGNVSGPFNRLRNIEAADKIKRSPPQLPGQGPYITGVIDVPWAAEPGGASPSETGRGYFKYPTMNDAELIAFGEQVAPLCDPAGGHIWFWSTNHHLVKTRSAFKVLDAWAEIFARHGVPGLEIVHMRTWGKDKMGRGQVLRGQTEQVLLVAFGKNPPPIQLTNQSTLIEGPVREDSRKPDQFYADVEALTPAPRYFELFARRELPPNWDGHGDQVGTLGAKIQEAAAKKAATVDAKLAKRIAALLKAKDGNAYDVAECCKQFGYGEVLDAARAAAAGVAQFSYDHAGHVRWLARAIADAAKSEARLAEQKVGRGRSEKVKLAREAAAHSQDAVLTAAEELVVDAELRMAWLVHAAAEKAGLKDGMRVRYKGKLHDGRSDQWIKDPAGTLSYIGSESAAQMICDRMGDVTMLTPDDLEKRIEIIADVEFETFGEISRGLLRVLSAIEAGTQIEFNENDHVIRGLTVGKHKRKLTKAGVAKLKELRAEAARQQATPALPDALEALTADYVATVTAHHAAILSGDVKAERAACERIDLLEDKANGGTSFGKATDESPAEQLRRAVRAPIGTVPLWGGIGYFPLEIAGVPYLVGWKQGEFGFGLYQTCGDKPGVSETGFHSFTGCHGALSRFDYVDDDEIWSGDDESAPLPPVGVDEFCRQHVEAYLATSGEDGKRAKRAKLHLPFHWYRLPASWDGIDDDGLAYDPACLLRERDALKAIAAKSRTRPPEHVLDHMHRNALIDDNGKITKHGRDRLDQVVKEIAALKRIEAKQPPATDRAALGALLACLERIAGGDVAGVAPDMLAELVTLRWLRGMKRRGVQRGAVEITPLGRDKLDAKHLDGIDPARVVEGTTHVLLDSGVAVAAAFLTPEERVQCAAAAKSSADDLLEWKALGAIDCNSEGIGASGPGVDRLRLEGLIAAIEGRDRLTDAGRARLAELDARFNPPQENPSPAEGAVAADRAAAEAGTGNDIPRGEVGRTETENPFDAAGAENGGFELTAPAADADGFVIGGSGRACDVRAAIDAKVTAAGAYEEVRVNTHPALYEAFDAISHDSGAGAGYAAYPVPQAYADQIAAAEAALASLSAEELSEFAIGDEAAGDALIERLPALADARALLGAFFRGWWKDDDGPEPGEADAAPPAFAPSAKPGDDDQLDIPGFLRREASKGKVAA